MELIISVVENRFWNTAFERTAYSSFSHVTGFEQSLRANCYEKSGQRHLLEKLSWIAIPSHLLSFGEKRLDSWWNRPHPRRRFSVFIDCAELSRSERQSLCRTTVSGWGNNRERITEWCSPVYGFWAVRTRGFRKYSRKWLNHLKDSIIWCTVSGRPRVKWFRNDRSLWIREHRVAFSCRSQIEERKILRRKLTGTIV